jgi:hypothetical protein
VFIHVPFGYAPASPCDHLAQQNQRRAPQVQWPTQAASPRLHLTAKSLLLYFDHGALLGHGLLLGLGRERGSCSQGAGRNQPAGAHCDGAEENGARGLGACAATGLHGYIIKRKPESSWIMGGWSTAR